MTAQNSKARVAQATGDALTFQAQASQVVSAFVQGVEGVEAARAGLSFARVTQLSILAGIASAADFPTVDEDSWASWAKSLAQAFSAMKGEDGQPVYTEASIRSKVSGLKPALIGLSNVHAHAILAPQDGETLKAYQDRARQQLTKLGLYTPSASGAPKGSQAPKGKSGAPDGGKSVDTSKAPKESQMRFREACEVVAFGDKTLARLIGLAVATEREELTKLLSALVGD